MSINQTQALQFSNEAGQKQNLDVIYAKVLNILHNNSLGLWASAPIENPGQIEGGTVIYRIPELLKVKNYNTQNNDGQVPTYATKELQINQRKIVKYEVETFDRTGIQNPEQLLSVIANGIATAVNSHLDLIFFKFLAQNARQKLITKALSTTPTDLKNTRIEIADMNTDLTTAITKNIVGLNESDVLTITSPKLYSRLVEGLTENNGGDKSIELKAFGQIPHAKISGFDVIKHIYIGKNTTGILPTEEVGIDLSKIQAFIFNKTAIAFAVRLKELNTILSERNGNPVYILKFDYGIEKLRDNMIIKVATEA